MPRRLKDKISTSIKEEGSMNNEIKRTRDTSNTFNYISVLVLA